MSQATARLREEDVHQALQNWLGEDGVVEVSRDSEEGRITGFVAHPSFTGVSLITRREWLIEGYPGGKGMQEWEGLRKLLGPQYTQIGLIFTYSPIEYESIFERPLRKSA